MWLHMSTRAAIGFVARALAPILIAVIVIVALVLCALLTGCADTAPGVDGATDAHPLACDIGQVQRLFECRLICANVVARCDSTDLDGALCVRDCTRFTTSFEYCPEQ